MARVLVLGATGYVGGRLVPRLLDDRHEVAVLTRDRRRLEDRPWSPRVAIHEGDALHPESLRVPFGEAEIVYYLVHSMAAGEGEFERLDREAARHVSRVAADAGVARIIYLGGLGDDQEEQSAHLRSRNEVGRILRAGTVPVTEFRAAVIVGSGSLSFELIHHLTNRLPVMICPRWIYTRTQPIGINDVIAYLRAAPSRPESAGKQIDIGGPDVLTYGDMIRTVARVLGLRRLLISVPVLTPRLSSYWINLVTPVPVKVARPLIEGLRYPTVCNNTEARKLFDIRPEPFEQAVQRALQSVAAHRIETRWTGAAGSVPAVNVDSSHLKYDRRVVPVRARAEDLYAVFASIGGANGWYYANWLWRIRGFIDKQVGGVGLRRGRRHPLEITTGEALDFWRVEAHQKYKLLRLKAEMRVWGHAWLQFETHCSDTGLCTLIQTAEYYPRGLFGHAYWYSVYPLHALVFRGLSRAIAQRAEARAIASTEADDKTVSERPYELREPGSSD